MPEGSLSPKAPMWMTSSSPPTQAGNPTDRTPFPCCNGLRHRPGHYRSRTPRQATGWIIAVIAAFAALVAVAHRGADQLRASRHVRPSHRHLCCGRYADDPAPLPGLHLHSRSCTGPACRHHRAVDDQQKWRQQIRPAGRQHIGGTHPAPGACYTNSSHRRPVAGLCRRCC